MTDVVITSATRTAIGSYGKGLAGSAALGSGRRWPRAAAIERAGIEPDQIDQSCSAT